MPNLESSSLAGSAPSEQELIERIDDAIAMLTNVGMPHRFVAPIQWLRTALPGLLATARDGERLAMVRSEVEDFAAFFACAGPDADVGQNAISRLRCVLPKILAGKAACPIHLPAAAARSTGSVPHG